ncbi:hypothetical protein O181_058620 [Austropuccinia psidii MF-1]|uniref:Uncharacterized protein n=1 Tax=Austropuccinia psidii MF-1 TaxID=1389203 RepID=A0A9Q3HY09_9BASI|nr:hypothetical protein [Austropuccinia psidii MF-1]
MLANKHTRNACLLSNPSDHVARGVPDQEALARSPLWSTMTKAFPSGNGRRDTKQADSNNSKQLAQSPQDGNGKRTFKLVPIVTHGIQMPKAKPTKSPIPSLPRKKSLRQPTPGPSSTQWLEDLFGKPPIAGSSPSSEPHEDVPTCELEPEVALTQSMEEPFGKSQLHFFYSPFLQPSPAHPTLPHSAIIIDNTPIGSPSQCLQEPCHLLPSVP